MSIAVASARGLCMRPPWLHWALWPVLLVALVLPMSGQAAGRVALVVGNAAYADRPLRNPVNDAQLMQASLKQLGFDVTESHTNFVWATRSDRPVKPIYEALKAQGILVRYMDYTQSTAGSWGDGLRISVGTDGEIDAMLMVLEGVLG